MIHAREDYSCIQDPLARLDGTVDELRKLHGRSPIASDEPVMLFRAKDKLAPLVILYYAQLLAMNCNPDMAEVTFNHAALMMEWQRENGMKSPDLPGQIPELTELELVKLECKQLKEELSELRKVQHENTE